MARRRLTSVPDGATAKKFDPWEFVDGTGYSPDKFYMSSKDDKGHYERLPQCKVPTDIIDRAKGFAADEMFPYESVNDFVRDSMVHRLVALGEMGYIKDPELMGWVRTQILKGAIATKEAAAAGFSDLLSKLRDGLNLARVNQDEEGFRDLLDAAQVALADQREPYAGKLAGLIKEFGGTVG